MKPPSVPSIRSRLANALVLWSVVWGLSVGAAVWLAATHEVDELLDDTLQSSAELLWRLDVARAANGATPHAAIPATTPGGTRFAWQVVGADGRLRARSERAPAVAWHGTPSAGFSSVAGWRLYGLALGASGPGSPGDMLYAAQTLEERREAGAEVALGAVLAAAAVGLLGHLWLRSRTRAELQPLQRLSDRLAGLEPGMGGGPDGGAALEAALGPPERRELVPVHQAVAALSQRLALRLANERAFAAHAAHALRTPLAGIDAQLAVALRQCPPGPAAELGDPAAAPDLHERLLRVRSATTRLQAVVAALLGLFRSGGALQRQSVDLQRLAALLPVPRLQVEVAPGSQVQADSDLLAAALLNLLDNAVRHGAQRVWLDQPAPQRLRLRDDGPGVPASRLQGLRQALATQDYEGRHGPALGLGLMLADRVARAHGGGLHLPDLSPDLSPDLPPGPPTDQAGFAVELDLGPATASDPLQPGLA